MLEWWVAFLLGSTIGGALMGALALWLGAFERGEAVEGWRRLSGERTAMGWYLAAQRELRAANKGLRRLSKRASDVRRAEVEAERYAVEEIICRAHPLGGCAEELGFFEWYETNKDGWISMSRAAGAWLSLEITAHREHTPASPGNSPTAASAPGGAGDLSEGKP